jgi:mono/diheme cytochrome c family protein
MLLLLAMVICAPAVAGDPFYGRTLHADNCESCHGTAGQGDGFSVAAYSEGSIPFSMDTEILPIIKDGQGVMPAFGTLLTDQEILDIISFIRTLD